MTQEDKQLLLKDLCARLPYGVKFQGEDSNVYTLDASNYFALQVEDMVFKPYLRSMSSMSEEEKEEFNSFVRKDFANSITWSGSNILLIELDDFLNWLNTHHFDYHRLIERGFAFEALEGMYKSD